MKKILVYAILILAVTACRPSAPATVLPAITEAAGITQPPTTTEKPLPTAVPTFTDVPTPTLEPTVTPTATPAFDTVPRQWSGSYTYSGSVTPGRGMVQRFTFLIEHLDGTTFTGKMIWQGFQKYHGSMIKMHGWFVTDFGDELDQARWNNVEDYKNGDRAGVWLKWTETEIIDGAGYYTLNGWYYAHIRDDETMTAVYFFNATETVADFGKFILVPSGR